MTDSPRLQELRRRVQADPASIAFAQLAEECRRAGVNDEAVQICRNGLATHPGYLSARVTLGRALIELGQLDDANRELNIVVQTAPDNMAAIRGLAEICQQQGRLKEALAHYKHALTLASHDADLENTVDRISQAIAPPPPPKAPDVPAVAVEELFDFDKLLAELGESSTKEAPASLSPAFSATPLEMPDVLKPTGGADLAPDDRDELASMERELRAFEEQRAADERRLREDEEQLLRELEEQRLKDEAEDRQRALEAQRLRDEEEQLLRELEEQRLKDEAEDRERALALEARRLREQEDQLLKELEEQRLKDEEEERRLLVRKRHDAVLNGLEGWLGAIIADRDHHDSL